MRKLRDIKIAIVHDWLTGMRGGEKVLEAFCELFPDADIYTLLWDKDSVSDTIEKHRINTSFLQYIPKIEKNYRYYLPLMPFAISSFNLDRYDLVISSSHCVAKGVKTKKEIPHICYCYTPMRYIWDQYDEYFNAKKSGFIVNLLMFMVRPFLQDWDVESSRNVKEFIGISEHIINKIKKYYNRDAKVIYPPVDVENYPNAWDGNYYLMVTAMVPYKRTDLAIEVFNELKYPLKIIGKGPDESKLRKMANPNIEFLGWLSDEEIKRYYSGCKAFIFPQEEDFGITAVEAQAAGKPVIAFGKGGAAETVINGLTGVYFSEPTHEGLKDCILKFEKMNFDKNKIRENALKFSREHFKKEIVSFFSRYIEF
ncbi:MAG: glycosyltransferase [Elusimicrobia bacterium]|nr:glycosyltransferase [Candidatus Liberimonas magnetica]